MEHISQNLANQTVSPPPSTPPRNKSSPPSKEEQHRKTLQLRHLLNQSFQIFNLYGKEPEQLTAIFQGFSMILKDETEGDITTAFLQWMREKSVMPTPAEIYALCRGYVAARADAAKYQVRAQMAAPVQKERVSWFGLQWDEFTEQHKRDLAEHLKTLSPIQSHRYQKFLRNHFGYPYNVEVNGQDDE